MDITKVVTHLGDAVPDHLKHKIPYEDAIALIANRWVWLSELANPDNVFISFLMLYHTTEAGRKIFSEKTATKILTDYKARLGHFEGYSNPLASALLEFFQKGVPMKSFDQFLDPSIRTTVAKAVKALIALAFATCSDYAVDDLSYVMTQKIPGVRQITS